MIFLTFLVYLQILLQNYGTKGSQKGKKNSLTLIFAEEGESNPNPKLSRKFPKNLRLERKSSSNMSKDTGGGVKAVQQKSKVEIFFVGASLRQH